MRSRITAAAALALTLSTALPASGQLTPLSLNQRIEGAPLIIEGRVMEGRSYWNESRTMIYTSTGVSVYKVLKGDSAPRQVVVVTRGGTVGLDRVVEEPSLTLRAGEIGVLFLEPREGILTASKNAGTVATIPASGPQSFIRYDEISGIAADAFSKYHDIESEIYSPIETSTGQAAVEVVAFDGGDFLTSSNSSSQLVPSITSFTPASITGGTQSVLTVNGSGFGTFTGAAGIFFLNVNVGGSSSTAAPSTHIVSWSDNQIKVWVPSFAGSGVFAVRDVNSNITFCSSDPGDDCTTDLFVQYNVVNVDPETPERAVVGELVDSDDRGGYTWLYNTAFAANTQARTRLEAAMETWRCETGLNFVIDDPSVTTTSADSAGLDGINLISFDTNELLPGGVLGRTTSRFRGCADQLGNEEWFLREIDMIYDEAPAGGWYYGADPGGIGGSEIDFESVSLHEIGHAHQIAHTTNPGAVMLWAIGGGDVQRTPTASSDVAAGEFVMARSGDAFVPCQSLLSHSAMIAVEPGVCSNVLLPVELTSLSVIASGEDLMVSWSTASETNNAGFEVQHRLADNPDFVIDGFVDGAGNARRSTSYSYRIEGMDPGTYTVRLRQVDFDGASVYSPEVEAKITITERYVLTEASPNPFNPTTTFALAVKESEHVRVDVFDILGRRVASLFDDIADANRTYRFTLEAAGMPSGTYLYRATGESFAVTKTVVLTK